MADGKPLNAADIAKIAFLEGIPEADAQSAAAVAELRELGQAAVVFEEGDDGQELYVILDGSVAIEKDIAGEEPRLLATLGPGVIFGEINFLLASARSATARAVAPTRVAVFTREGVAQLEAAGTDQQLEKAVEVLLAQLTRSAEPVS